ncbi:MFS transporter, partial [Pseudomonas syringae group genomosp. 7]|uniref:MFS transporter n=1 Tax=Pseudomonas syringae group genomosp. 7 TaxID=251699 RepID=UPI003770772B
YISELGPGLGVFRLGIAFCEIPWGRLTERWGARPVLLTGLLSSGIALLILAILASYASTVVLLASVLILVGLLVSSV